MVKTIKKVLAIILILCVSVMPLQGFAEGLTTTTNTTETTTTDSNGNTTVTITFTSSTTGTTADGITVNSSETRIDTTVTDADGNVISTAWQKKGSETREWTEEDNGNTPGQLKLTIPVEPGTTTDGSASKTTTSGGTTTITAERTGEATTTESEITVQATGASNLTPIQPDKSIVDSDMSAEQLLEKWTYKPAKGAVAATAAPEGYDYRYTSFGQMSDFYVGLEGGKYSGALQFQLEYDPYYVPGSTTNKTITPEDIFISYCADVDTDAKANYWYRLDSLEDSGYYDESSAEMIRAIALGGYWGTGTKTVVNEDGTTSVVNAIGSLAKLKDDMKAALKAGKISGITEAEIDALTQGQAVNATQAAIWTYANSTTGKAAVDKERLAIKGNGGDVPSAQDLKQTTAIYDYLLSLDPIKKGEANEVIDHDAFIKDGSMSLTIGDKVTVADANKDDNQDNDVYEVALNFALVVTPSNEKDDLIVQIITGYDSEGNPIISAQGRIAGGNTEEDSANGFHKVSYNAETGVYSLENLVLAENSDFNFDLKLVGTQYLQEGVYIFTSEARGTDSNKNGILDDSEKVYSQTFVTLLEGDKEVNVRQGFTMNFNVDENNKIVTKRSWKDEYDPSFTPDGEEPIPVPPRENKVIVRKPTETIIDEAVPLAAVPKTGDLSIILIGIIAAAALGLIILTFCSKNTKAKHN